MGIDTEKAAEMGGPHPEAKDPPNPRPVTLTPEQEAQSLLQYLAERARARGFILSANIDYEWTSSGSMIVRAVPGVRPIQK